MPTVFRGPRNSMPRNLRKCRGIPRCRGNGAVCTRLQANCVDSCVVMRTCRSRQHLYSEAAATRQPEHWTQTALPTAQTATDWQGTVTVWNCRLGGLMTVNFLPAVRACLHLLVVIGPSLWRSRAPPTFAAGRDRPSGGAPRHFGPATLAPRLSSELTVSLQLV